MVFKRTLVAVFALFAVVSPTIGGPLPDPSLDGADPSKRPPQNAPRPHPVIPNAPERLPADGEDCSPWQEQYSFSGYTWVKGRLCGSADDEGADFSLEISDAQYFWFLQWYRWTDEFPLYYWINGREFTEKKFKELRTGGRASKPQVIQLGRVKDQGKSQVFGVNVDLTTSGPYWGDGSCEIDMNMKLSLSRNVV